MSNTSKGEGTKGSKFWIQKLVNTPKLKNDFDKQIKDELFWISPLKSEEYAEYKLNQRSLLEKLKKMEIILPEGYFDFWPSNQPQWDGIALSLDRKTLYIIEAKANIKEMETKLSATSLVSKKKIIHSMQEVHDKYYYGGEFDSWIKKYYQLGNRLTFLKKLNERPPEGIEKVKLILLNFADDLSYIYVSAREWMQHYEEVWKEMIGIDKCPDDVIVTNFSVKNKIVPNPMNGTILKKDHPLDFSDKEYRKIYKEISLSNAEQYADFILENIAAFKDYKHFGIEMRNSYVVDTVSHSMNPVFHSIPCNQNGEIVREEEWICKKMLGRELSGIGKIVDYQVPLKCPGSTENNGLGKIDMLSLWKEDAIVLELKVEKSSEHPLKAIMEAYTYWMHLGGNNAVEFINKSRAIGAKNLRKGIVIYGTDRSKIFQLLKNSEKTKQIMHELKVELFTIYPTGELEFEIKNEEI